MHPIYFKFREKIYTGYTNGHWFFGAPSAYYNVNEFQQLDITRFPVDKLFADNCLILPPQINNAPLHDWLKTKHCTTCNNLQYITCHQCAGHGITTCRCNCGQAHMTKCSACYGRGQLLCNECKTTNISQGYIKIAELVVDKALCLELVCRAQSQTIYMATGTDIVMFRDGVMLMGLMAVTNQSSYEYCIVPIANAVCIPGHQHCWHPNTAASAEICCWCGNQRALTQHGEFIYPQQPATVEAKILSTEEFVF